MYNFPELSDLDLGWLAGILEGEGSFHLSRSRGYSYPAINLTSTDKDTVEKIASVVGVGRVRGPYTVSPRWGKPLKLQYRWDVQGAHAEALFQMLRPHLSSRRKQQIDEAVQGMITGKRYNSGQSLVEFALVIPLFLMLMAGLLDGTRMLFVYNSLQEAARAGARWGAVNVGRVPWVDPSNFTTYPDGNATGTYPNVVDHLSISSGGSITTTVVGQVASKLIAVDHSLTTVDIAGTSGFSPPESGTQDGNFRPLPVTVKVSYTFRPVLGFGHFGIKLVGEATAYHE